MARPLRIQGEGFYYHIIQRGTEKRDIFRSDWDKERFLKLLETAHSRYKAIIHSFVLMDNHYHLILETEKPNLSQIMHYIDTGYAVYHNLKYNRVGPLYQGRYKSIIIEHDDYLHYLSRYIHLNPVRAKVVNTPIEYKWSSYRYFVTHTPPPSCLNVAPILGMFGYKIKNSIKAYRSFVEDNIGQETDIIRKNTLKGFILGDIEFLKKIHDQFIDRKCDEEIPAIRQMASYLTPTLEYISALADKNIQNNVKLSKKVKIYLARKYTSMSLKDIGRAFGGIRYANVSIITKRLEQKKNRHKKISKILARLEKMLNVKT